MRCDILLEYSAFNNFITRRMRGALPQFGILETYHSLPPSTAAETDYVIPFIPDYLHLNPQGSYSIQFAKKWTYWILDFANANCWVQQLLEVLYLSRCIYIYNMWVSLKRWYSMVYPQLTILKTGKRWSTLGFFRCKPRLLFGTQWFRCHGLSTWSWNLTWCQGLLEREITMMYWWSKCKKCKICIIVS